MNAASNWHFEALGATFALVSDCALATSKLEALLSGYQVSNAPADTLYEFRRSGAYLQLIKDGEGLWEDELDETLNFFLLDLYRSLALLPGKHWLLHAAAVVRDEQVLILAGPSNAGKSTLTRGLLRRGWSYLSEEMVSIAAQGIDALRRPLHLDAPEELDGITGFMAPCPLQCGSGPVWISAPMGPRPAVQGVQAIVRLYYEPEQVTSLQRLKASEALIELWQCRMNAGLTTAEIAATTVTQMPCYRLIAANETSALDQLAALCLP